MGCGFSYLLCLWHAVIDAIRKTGDSCGGEVTCIVRRCPKGLGAPVFGKLEAELAGALMSLPASKVRYPVGTHASAVLHALSLYGGSCVLIRGLRLEVVLLDQGYLGVSITMSSIWHLMVRYELAQTGVAVFIAQTAVGYIMSCTK